MGNATEGKGGAVPDRLYTGDGPSSLQECLCPGPSAQLGTLHGPGFPAKRLPDRTQEVLRGKEAVADETANKTYTGGQNFRGPTEGRPESATARGKTERVDIGGDVEACRRESLHALGSKERAGAKKMTRASDKGEFGGGSEMKSE